MLNLKEVKIRPYKFIFHVIDRFTRYTISILLKYKKAITIINGMKGSWVATFRRPRKYWSDVGGEFNINIVLPRYFTTITRWIPR